MVAAHHWAGEESMNGMLGTRKPTATTPAPTSVFLSFELGDSCQRRIRRKGAATRAICFVAPAKPAIKSPRFRLLYHSIAPPTRKNAQTLSVQLAATKAGKNTNGTRLNAFCRDGTSPKIKRTDRMWNTKTPSRRSRRPAE